MSYIVENVERANGKRSLVRAENGKWYCVDTCLTFDHGWETMVFPYDADKGKVKNWNDLCCKIYESEDQALSTHAHIAKNIGIYVELWG